MSIKIELLCPLGGDTCGKHPYTRSRLENRLFTPCGRQISD